MNTFASLDLLATAMVAHADATNTTFPFVTLPHFANHAAKILSMSAGISLWTFLIVKANQRREWEEYAWSHRYIVNETLHIIKNGSEFVRIVFFVFFAFILLHIFVSNNIRSC
jgi:hypothetical protein